MTDKKCVHLVDDDEAIRHSASFMLRQAGYTVRTYAGGTDFLDALEGAEAGCVLLDVRMPDMDGLAVQRELNQRAVNMPVVVLTGHGDVSVAVEAMKAGAVDFLEKPYDKASLVQAINSAFSRLQNDQSREALAARAREKLASLTTREREVLERLVRGQTNKSIADDLSISARTVEIHRAHVMEKLEADSLSSALRLAFSAGLGEAQF